METKQMALATTEPAAITPMAMIQRAFTWGALYHYAARIEADRARQTKTTRH